MPLIQSTKKLLKEVPIDGQFKEVSEILGNWHANLIMIERRKCVLFTHDATLYSVLVPGIKKKDFPNLATIFLEELISNLRFEGFGSHVEQLIHEYQNNVLFVPTANRRILGTMIDMVHCAKSLIEMNPCPFDEIDFRKINHQLNRTPFKVNDYVYAVHLLCKILDPDNHDEFV